MTPLRHAPSRLSAPAGRIKLAPKIAADVYSTPAWRALIKTLLAQRGRRCQQCGSAGTRIYGDHIHELRDGGEPFAAGNIQLLCGACHARKTATARAARRDAK